MTPETTALSTFLSDVGTVFTSLTGWVGDVIGVIMDNPVLLVPFAVGLAFTAVRLFHALRS